MPPLELIVGQSLLHEGQDLLYIYSYVYYCFKETYTLFVFIVNILKIPLIFVALLSSIVLISCSKDIYFSGISENSFNEIKENYQNINYETPSNFLGKAQRIEDGVGRYIEFCKNSFSKSFNLKSFKLLIDCANGATYQIAPKIFFELGANVDLCNVSPDGKNINLNCGVLNPKLLISSFNFSAIFVFQ